MNDAHIDHIGDKQGILCPFNSSGSGVILTVGIPAAGRPRSVGSGEPRVTIPRVKLTLARRT